LNRRFGDLEIVEIAGGAESNSRSDWFTSVLNHEGMSIGQRREKATRRMHVLAEKALAVSCVCALRLYISGYLAKILEEEFN
jgi:hypothetical protein